MPTYEYECEECHRTYEVRQRISAPALTQCQYCKGPVRRLLSAAPFILKGGGWYVTDYPSESRKRAMDAEKKSDAPAAKSGDAGKSAEGAKSGDGAKSAEGAKSGDGGKPAEGAKSGDRGKSAKGAKSADGGVSGATKTESSSTTSGSGGSSTTP